MSNALAVATVTQALALLIEHNLHPEIDMAVSVETRKPPADPPTDPTITVFLYQVSHNPSMRNSDLVTRAADGTLLKRPAAAIDLHFVISAYGEETELVGQRLIGSVVRTLHEIPVLPRELIEEAAQRPYLEGSDLAESLQKVRFTPTQMDVDETSKLWGMLHNTPYSLSVVYQASLVLLDGHQKPAPARPVRRPEVQVLPFGAPGAPEPPESPEPAESAELPESAQLPELLELPESPDVGGSTGATGAAGGAGAGAGGTAAGARSTRTKAAGVRSAKKAAGGAAAGRGGGTSAGARATSSGTGAKRATSASTGAKSSGTPTRSRARKSAGGTAGDGGRDGARRETSNTDQPGRRDEPGRANEPSRAEEPGRTDQPGRTNKPGRTDEPGQTDQPGRTNKPGRTDNPDRTGEPGRTDEPGPAGTGAES
ncbi:Pvc16 family protein [Streptomyces decoyicus]|uniref:Pvc16 family protein n=1 Tax=Streptomyces decoyicus TaxID=249567 RepID=UPI003643777C